MINRAYQSGWNDRYTIIVTYIVCVEVLRPSQPNGVMSSAVIVTYWTSSWSRGKGGQGGQIEKGGGGGGGGGEGWHEENKLLEHGLEAYQSHRYNRWTFIVNIVYVDSKHGSLDSKFATAGICDGPPSWEWRSSEKHFSLRDAT